MAPLLRTPARCGRTKDAAPSGCPPSAPAGCPKPRSRAYVAGAIIDAIQEADTAFDGIVINPGAYTHYSYAIHDALKAVSIPAVEVHMSDIQKREEFRHLSVTAPACIAQIRGHGFESYTMAIDMLAKLNPEEK